ncbi:MAG: Thiamine-monophosphate kinase [Verrucomicrobiales bacterium]|jgi:thiamine-monophosphate kinase|nr:Thiamine-monophosphate kinase [Verrucomicrobiales bacterium]
MNELELIRQLTAKLPANEYSRVGAGDDCAVLDLGIPGSDLLFKTDAVVEGVHFSKSTPAELIGRKALGRCLSDIAAMGGKPVSVLVTLALPGSFEPKSIQTIYDGMASLAERYHVSITGGETTSNPERLLISVAAIGLVPKGKAILRSGALPGDAIFVTGDLGGSIHGKHLEFEPRIREGEWLAREFKLHAMIDLSDGLASDLRHILDQSKVGADLHSDSIPISRMARLQARAESSAKPPLLAALTDGEDFELAFTVVSRDAVPLLDAWKKEFPEIRLSCVGRISNKTGLRLSDKNGSRELNLHGYVHFAQS